MGFLWGCIRWRTINGNRVCVKEGWTPAAAVLVVGSALALGASGVGAAASLGGGSSSASAANGGSAKPNSKPKPKANGSGIQDIRRLLQRAHQHAETKESDTGTDCATTSYGQVRDFFREHPCDALARALVEVRSGRAVALVAVAIVDMPDEQGAIALKRLVDVQGTGNITELTGEGRFTGRFYASRREGTTVVNAQVEPVGRAAAAVALAELAAQTLR